MRLIALLFNILMEMLSIQLISAYALVNLLGTQVHRYASETAQT